MPVALTLKLQVSWWMCLYPTYIKEKMNLTCECHLPTVVEEASLWSRLSCQSCVIVLQEICIFCFLSPAICISCLLWLVEMPRSPHCQSLSHNHEWEYPLRYRKVSEKFFSIISSPSVSVCFCCCNKITQLDQFITHRNSSLLDPEKSRIKLLEDAASGLTSSKMTFWGLDRCLNPCYSSRELEFSFQHPYRVAHNGL